jgi:tRNA pseudouridine(55) synthase
MSELDFNLKDTVSGVLVIDKPVGMTSHSVVQVVRQGTGIRRAGHTGTLDPRASGVLVVLLGPAVRLSEYISASDKRYQAIIRLGETTDTFDGDGEVISRAPVDITLEEIEEALKKFEGRIEQVPPAYSAKRIHGKKAYELAREGEEVELEPKEIDVYCLSGTRLKLLLMFFVLREPMCAPWRMIWVKPWVVEVTWLACAGPKAVNLPSGMRSNLENWKKLLIMVTGINI